jgi:hypothetical protein
MDKQASVYRIDERVLFVMISLIIICSLVLSFRFKNVEPCSDVHIAASAANYYAGSLISFRAEAAGGKTYEWQFSDGTKVDMKLRSIQHAFTAPGKYIISVVVNGHCEGLDSVFIQEAPVLRKLSLQPEFSAPDTAIVNRPVTFIDNTSDATSWEWRFGESGIVDETSQKVSCTYRTPGPKTIYLKINGRSDRVSTRTIYVRDAAPLVRVDQPRARQPNVSSFNIDRIPTTPRGGVGPNQIPPKAPELVPPPKTYADVQADEMIILIQGIVSGEKKPADFSLYFCEEMNIPVTYNGTPMKFSQMYNLLREFKKINNISKPEVQLIKNSSTNCIRMMVVNVTRRSWLDKVINKNK